MVTVSESSMARLTDLPRIGSVVADGMADARKHEGRWVACLQLLSLGEWYCLFVGRPFAPREPQLALKWLPDSRRWCVALAGAVPELAEQHFRPYGFRIRFPRLMVERYYPWGAS